jgi:hypothetical protein
LERIHATEHYDIDQPRDGSFRIVPRHRKARQILADILAELELDTETEPIRHDGSYTVRRDNPFGLVRLTERCEARMTLAKTRELLESTDAEAVQSPGKAS